MLTAAARIAVFAGAAGSVALTLYTGRRNPSLLLMALFVIWVLAPFVALAWANAHSRLHALSVLVAAASLAIYGTIALGPPTAKPAFWFLVVPAAAWLAIATGLIASRRSPAA